jgi:beta-glucanase (GH16 family)
VRTATGVKVTDGTLNIRFRASNGKPMLSALVVRRQSQPIDQWKLLWSDEFDYEGRPDPGKWTHNVWRARRVNDEDQAYTDRLKNVEVKGGNLLITAHREDYDDARYTSGRIHSSGKGDLLYGRVDVRARLPAGKGTWPAIWMMPSNPFTYASNCDENTERGEPCDAWPNSGEIDIMEHVGYDMQTVHGTVHSRAYYWKNGEQRKASIEAKSVDSEFHVYSMEWSPEHISILFDDIPYFYYANEHAGWESWPFDQPFHVILNMAIGGGWGRAGGGIDDSIFPVKLEVDYVRMFQRVDEAR